MLARTTGTTRQPRARLLAPFKPLPWQVAPWRDCSRVLLLTGSAGGGKSKLAAEKIHGFCLKYPGAMGLMVRKNRQAMTNSTVLFFDRKVVGGDPRVRHMPSKYRFEYANGAVLAYGGMNDREQREQIRSVGQDGGVDFIWMEEGTAFEESDFNELLPRLRGKAAPWRQLEITTNPDAPTHWIYRRLIVNHEAAVYYSSERDNPHNPADYRATLEQVTGVDHDRLVKGQWVQASGLIYDVWADGPDDGNVTEAADYEAGAGPIYWACDDGYSGKLDPATTLYTAESHPRVFLLIQERHDGRLCVFAESYEVQMLSEAHIAEVVALGYPAPDLAVVDKSAAELKGRLHALGVYTQNGPADVEESIKELRRGLAKDANGRRRFLVHPRCRHLRSEMASYRRDDTTGKPVKAFDHGPDGLRYFAWAKRYA